MFRLELIAYRNCSDQDFFQVIFLLYKKTGYGLTKHDDEYYLDRGSEPPRFAYYRHVRAEEWEALGHKPWDHEYDSRITQDELDFILKRNLRIPPEERYQREKAHWYWHESSWYWRGLDATGYDGYGCNGECIPTMELIITPYNGIQYSGGIGGGSFSKLAVKLPNLVTLRFADVSFDAIPNALRNALSGAFETVDAFMILLELPPKFSVQLLN